MQRRIKSRVQEHIMSIYYCVGAGQSFFWLLLPTYVGSFVSNGCTHTRGALSNLNKYIKTTTHLHSFPCVQSACGISFFDHSVFHDTTILWGVKKCFCASCYLPSIRLKYIVSVKYWSHRLLTQKGVHQKVTKFILNNGSGCTLWCQLEDMFQLIVTP